MHRDRLPGAVRDSLTDECTRCLKALDEDDIRYFVDRLHAKDKWRILDEYRARTSFFDIETVGLEHDARISVIVVWHRGKLHEFVEHENLDDFLDLLDEVELLASFNGSSFDVPRVLDAFHIPELPCPHLDLRWLCYHHGYPGGLKEITSRLGIRRPHDLHHADGELAIRLWQRWNHFQDRPARELLLRYCAADVLLLAILAERLGLDAAASEAPEMYDQHNSQEEAAAEAPAHPLWQCLPPVAPSTLRGLGVSEPGPTPTPIDAAFGPGAPTKLRARRSRFAS